MGGIKAAVRVSAATLLGVVALVAVSKYVLSVDLGSMIDYVSSVPAELIALVLVTRSIGPLLHSAQFYLIVKIYGYDLGFRKTLVGVYSTLALEYLVPVGGATEVGRVAFLVREKISPDKAIQVTFLHRLAHSAFVAMELAFVIFVTTRINGLVLWLLPLVLAVNALNLAVVASARHPRISRFLSKLASRLSFRGVEPESVAIPKRRSLAIVFLFIGLEKASSVLSGYLLLSYLTKSAGLVQSLLIFDILLATFWLLPIVTPAGVGQVEAVQLLASAAMNLETGAALSAIILYRLVTTVSVLPQLLLALIKYGASNLAEIRGRGAGDD